MSNKITFTAPSYLISKLETLRIKLGIQNRSEFIQELLDIGINQKSNSDGNNKMHLFRSLINQPPLKVLC